MRTGRTSQIKGFNQNLSETNMKLRLNPVQWFLQVKLHLIQVKLHLIQVKLQKQQFLCHISD